MSKLSIFVYVIIEEYKRKEDWMIFLFDCEIISSRFNIDQAHLSLKIFTFSVFYLTMISVRFEEREQETCLAF